jgi:predicted DNA-binding transcriptional regulator AlpA
MERMMMIDQPPTASASWPKFLDQDAVAELLGLSPRTLERFRLEGRGPSFRKFGRRVMYAMADVVAWADEQRRFSTSDMAGGGRGEDA